ncbi:Chaperone DnaJ-domain superfamily protein [Hirschfeldia incana]|nr:Chaperone DnaJ-domain superfamily protein [Hirschfeldia incana]
MGESTNRSEAERLLGISEKLLESRDLNGSKEFAILAQETEPLLEGTDQILAVVDVLLASSAENRINSNQPNWYKILQIEDPDQSSDLIKKQYRRLALLLHPDKNRLPYADQAFRLVADAWEVLSTASKKSQFDLVFTKVDLNRNGKKKGGGTTSERLSTFWTACPYCYALHEYPRVYLEYCIRCQNCQRAFHAASVPQLPPLVPGKDEYYCCWGFFPMGFVGGKGGEDAAKFPNWMPPVFGQNDSGVAAPTEPNVNGAGSSRGVPISFDGWSSGSGKRDGEAMRSDNGGVSSDGMPKKRGRGRPKKNI